MEKEYKPIYKQNIRLENTNDIRKMLARISNALIQHDISEDRARTLTYVANTMITCIKQGDIEERITELEKLINEK